MSPGSPPTSPGCESQWVQATLSPRRGTSGTHAATRQENKLKGKEIKSLAFTCPWIQRTFTVPTDPSLLSFSCLLQPSHNSTELEAGNGRILPWSEDWGACLHC